MRFLQTRVVFVRLARKRTENMWSSENLLQMGRYFANFCCFYGNYINRCSFWKTSLRASSQFLNTWIVLVPFLFSCVNPVLWFNNVVLLPSKHDRVVVLGLLLISICTYFRAGTREYYSWLLTIIGPFQIKVLLILSCIRLWFPPVNFLVVLFKLFLYCLLSTGLLIKDSMYLCQCSNDTCSV